MTQRARPTLRCLREDLKQAVPRASTPLDEIDHPLLAKATERFTDSQTSQERISAIDDQVFCKVTVQRWRGAVWVEGTQTPWLVAAGHRQEGSPDDFYASLAACGNAACRRLNAGRSSPHGHKTYTGDLLPQREDRVRWAAEAAVRTERVLRTIVHALVRRSLFDGHEHTAMLDGAALGIQILADDGHETYAAIRIIGSVPRNLVGVVLSLIPGCELGAWMSDYAMPERAVAPEEQIWSNIMDPVAAAKFLDEEAET